MRCPYCGHRNDGVIDTRHTADGTTIRRRECARCRQRFTTRETLDRVEPLRPGRPPAPDVDQTDPRELRAHDLPARLRKGTEGRRR